MATRNGKTIPKGITPTPEELAEFNAEEGFYLQWARESVKSSLTLANNILKQLLTLSTALLGGSVVFLEKIASQPLARFLVILLFLTALIVSFIGIIPHEARLTKQLEQIKHEKVKALNHKRFFLKVASSCIALGFGIAFVSFLIAASGSF